MQAVTVETGADGGTLLLDGGMTAEDGDGRTSAEGGDARTSAEGGGGGTLAEEREDEKKKKSRRRKRVKGEKNRLEEAIANDNGDLGMREGGLDSLIIYTSKR